MFTLVFSNCESVDVGSMWSCLRVLFLQTEFARFCYASVTIDNLQGDYDLQTGRQRGLVLSIPQDRRNPGPDRSEATFDNYAATLMRLHNYPTLTRSPKLRATDRR